MLFHIEDDMAARLVSIMVDFSVKAAARILPSSVIRQQPSTPSFSTDLSTSGSLLAANIVKSERFSLLRASLRPKERF
jgi:hypothetical protein